MHEVTEPLVPLKGQESPLPLFSLQTASNYGTSNWRKGKCVGGDQTVFPSITSTLPVGKASGLLPRLLPFSRQQADTAVINEEEVTCQRRHLSHFVLNVIYVTASAGSRCPPSQRILFISGRRNLQKSKINKDNLKRWTSSRRTEQI